MVNGKIFPFERNRFYCGKLLTSNDFRDEQGYFNNKRHFLNKMLFGSGVISGFKTYAVDDTTLMIESGVAIDSLGREVVLEKSVVKKLSTIDGFGDVKSNKLKLYVEYAEKEINPMYALVKNDEGKEYEYNRIVEGARLFVQDAEESVRIFEADEKFIESKILFADENFELALKVPKFACKDFNFKVVAQLKKLSDANVDFSSEFMLHVPGFINEHGDNRIVFKINKVKLAAGKTLELVQDIRAEGVLASNATTFVVKESSAKFSSGSGTSTLKENIFINVGIRDAEPFDIVREQVTDLSMERIMAEAGKLICIADLEIVKVDAKTYVINKVTRPDVYSNIYVPVQQYAIEKMMDYYKTEKETVTLVKEESKKAESNGNTALITAFNSMISSGTFDIPMGGQNVKAGKVVFSDEIMHGLGTGEVFVEAGIEYILKGKNNNVNRKIIYGNSSIFGDNLPIVIDAEQAVQVLCEKGTFIVGVKFNAPANISSIKVKWFAFKTPEFSDALELEQDKEKSIFVKKNTLVVQPNEMLCIEVGFNNMPATTLKYEIIDKDGGTIDASGMYSAPNKEGVYEVKVSCVNAPEIYTYAYIIVTKKDA